MLTLILLVVLGGGLGILAVSMAEGKPATNDDESRRAVDAGETAGEDVDPPPAPGPPPEPEPEPEPEPPPPVAVPAGRAASVPAPAIAPPRRAAGPEPRLHRGSVPASQTAIEGQLGDLLHPSLPRRVVSLVSVAVIVVVVGVGIAALLGAIVGAAAEILGNAIG